MERIKKPRVIIRPWIPKKIPPTLTAELLTQLVQQAKPQIEKVIYAGWKANKIEGKRIIQFVLATGSTTKEARERFKNVAANNETVWIVEA